MRPYIAIIKDSFRAAMASRVLYVLLVLITLLLLAISPFHVRETLDWELSEANVRSPDRMVRRIVSGKSEMPVAAIWESFSSSTQEKMIEIVDGKDDQNEENEIPGMSKPEQDMLTYRDVIIELNEAIEDRDFYQAEDWEKTVLPSEAEELKKSGGLTGVRSKRLNRLLIATALSPEIETGKETALEFFYAFKGLVGPFGMTQGQFAQMLTSQLPPFFDKFVLSIGLLIAVLVTANLIPETFEAGSLNLLLSKPISRWGLYVAKFIGGCAFVSLCACYLFLGVWLWMGLAMGVWDRAMLLSIPLYIIVFAIYFSVSAFVGLLWRSAIVSVILTFVFWALCFSVGTGHGVCNMLMVNNSILDVVPVGDQVLSADQLQQIRTWNESKGAWEEKTEAKMDSQAEILRSSVMWAAPLKEHPVFAGLRDYISPVVDQKNNRIITSKYEFGQTSTGKKELLAADIGQGNVDLKKLKFKKVGDFPSDTVIALETKNGIVTVSSDGTFYRLNEDNYQSARDESFQARGVEDESGVAKSEPPTAEADKQETDNDKESTTTDAGDSLEMAETVDEPFELFDPIGPSKPAYVRSVNHVDYSMERDEFAIYQRGMLKIFASKKGGRYEARASLTLDLDFNKNMTALMAYAGQTIVVAFGNGKVITVDAEKLEEAEEYQPESRSGTVKVTASPSGRYFGILYRNGNLWLNDLQSSDRKIEKAKVKGQGQICAFSFTDEDQLWVASDADQIAQYGLSNNSATNQYAPSGGLFEKFFRYVLRPFYRVCPKPGEFYKVVTHLSSSGDALSNADVDNNRGDEASNPWLPLWSGLGFMAMMLFLGCTIFHFKDY